MEKPDFKQDSKGRVIHNPLKTNIIGKKVLAYDTVTSTNEVARNLAFEGQEEGTVVWARTQSAGYGRQKRIWYSPPGGLLFSVILRPDIPLEKATLTTLMGGAAAAWALRNRWGVPARIKWPNDVLVGGKKILGVLTEMRTEKDRIKFIVLGMGLNLNFEVDSLPREIQDISTTLKHETGHETKAEDVLFDILLRMDELYDYLRRGQWENILEEWRTYQDTLGRRVSIDTQNCSIEGMAVGVDSRGALVVKTADGPLETVVAGDCIHVYMKGR